MKRKTRLIVILATVFALIFTVGLFYIILSTMHKYSRKSAQSDAVIYMQDGKTVLATVVKEFNAHAVKKGGGMTSVSGSSKYYACAFDIANGQKLWEVRLSAKNKQGKTWGDAALLGQSDKYLFFLRNELFVISKADGKLIARNKDLKGIAGIAMNESTLFPSFINNNYVYDDSLHAVVIKGADGLAYLLDDNTLQSRPAPDIHIVRYFQEKQRTAEKRVVSSYNEQLVTFTRDDKRQFAFMDDNDHELLQDGKEPPYGPGEAPRRHLFTTQTGAPIASLEKLTNKVFLFGGFMKRPGADTVVYPNTATDFYKTASFLISRGNNHVQVPVWLKNGGAIVLHKASIAQNAPILLTALNSEGEKLWHIPTTFTEISNALQTHDHLYILSGEKSNRNGEAEHILMISLADGSTKDYNVKTGKLN